MTQTRSSTRLAAAIGLVCGLAGGVAGALVIGGRTTQEARVPAAPAVDTEIRYAIEALTREVRALNESLGNRLSAPATEPSSRAPASTPVDVDRLVAAIEGLAARADSAAPLSSTGRRDGPSLVVPARSKNMALLREIVDMDDELAAWRKYRFLTYQQVLDQFGPPDEVNNDNSWYYEISDSSSLTFRFSDGMLVNIF